MAWSDLDPCAGCQSSQLQVSFVYNDSQRESSSRSASPPLQQPGAWLHTTDNASAPKQTTLNSHSICMTFSAAAVLKPSLSTVSKHNLIPVQNVPASD